jgi:nucleoside-diphosphate-sugar epimerase
VRVLVTGASGFVGRALVFALTDAGHDARAAMRQPKAAGFPTGTEAALLGDMASPVDWGPLLAGVDAVVHLAGVAHAGTDIADARYDRINHQGTAELAAAAKQAGIKRFIFVSSVRAQSGPVADHVLTEADEPQPTDAYGRSKLAAEIAVRASGIAFTILRPVLVYGPGVKGNLAALARLASSPLPLPFGAFQNRRSLLSLDQLIAAIQVVLRDPASNGETYLVADAEPLSLADMIASLRQGLGRSPGLISVPPSLIRTVCVALGLRDVWSRLNGELIVDPKKLTGIGWKPAANTRTALTSILGAGAHAASIEADAL